MPKYKVELDGTQYMIEGDVPPTEGDVRALLSSSSSDSGVPSGNPSDVPTTTTLGRAQETPSTVNNVPTTTPRSTTQPGSHIPTPNESSVYDKVGKGIQDFFTINDVTKQLADQVLTGNYSKDAIASEKNKWDKMGVLGKAIDLMGRSGYGLKAAFNQHFNKNDAIYNKLLEEKGMTKDGWLTSREDAKNVYDEAKVRMMKAPVELKEMVQSMYRGLTGKERVAVDDLLKNQGIDQPLVAFAGEMISDPLMYGGLYGKGMKAIGGLTKEVSTAVMGVKPLAKVIQPVVDTIQEVGSWISKKSSQFPKLDELIDRHISERHYLKSTELQFAAKTRLAINSVATKLGIHPDELGRRVTSIAELRNYPDELARVVPNISNEERTLANTLKMHYDNMLDKELKAGVPIDPLSYQRTAQIDKVRKNLNVVRTSYGTQLAKARGSLTRELDLLADNKVNDYVKGLKGDEKDILTKIKMDNASKIKGLDANISSIDNQMLTLEKLKARTMNGGLRTETIQGKIANIDNELGKLASTGPEGDIRLAKFREKELLNQKRLLINSTNDLKDAIKKPVVDIDKQLAKLENQYWYLHSEMADRLQTLFPELVSGSKFVKQLDEIAGKLSGDIEVNLGAKGKSIANKIVKLNEKVGKLPQTELGVPLGEARKLLKELTILRSKREFGYVPRITVDQAKKMINGMKIGKSKMWTPQLQNALKRQTNDFTIDEWNDFVRAHSDAFKTLDRETVNKFFETDPAYITAVRGTRSAKAITSANFLNDAGSLFGKAVKDAPTDFVTLPDTVTKLNPSLKNLAFPAEVASEIGRVTQFYMDPAYHKDVWGDFLKTYDNIQDLWKKTQLVYFPKYHLRNAVGNVWNNYLAGVKPENYPKAAALQAFRKFRYDPTKGGVVRQAINTLGIKTEDASRLIDGMERLGVVNQGWFASDISETLAKSIAKPSLMDKGMAVGTTIENNARVAHFLEMTARGKTAEEAALSVKKFLFDYGDLTYLERSVLKRIMPFYSWTRKNIPLQLEAIYNTPEKFAPIAIPLRQREPNDLLRMKYGNPNLYNSLPVELRRTADSVTYIPLEGLLPAADLAKIPDTGKFLYDLLTMWLPSKKDSMKLPLATDLLSPFIKTPIELGLNKQMYNDMEIQQRDYQNEPLWGIDIPVRLKYLLTTVIPAARVVREIDKVAMADKREQNLTTTEKIFAGSLSTVYKTDLKTLRNTALYSIKKQLDELQTGAYRVKKQGREQEFKNIIKTYYKAIREIKRIK
jgi:hypothetical protein